MQRWGVDHWEEHSPVASWLTIRLMFAFSITCNLSSLSLDFTQAFPQADIKNEVYVEVPLSLTSLVGRAFVFRDEGRRFDPGISQVYVHCV